MASLGRLLASIVHEINTPIGSILSNNDVIVRSLDLIKKELAECQESATDRARDVVDTCRNLAAVDKIACERISSMIRCLKHYARGDTEELREVDLHENIRNMLKLMHGEFRRRILVETNFGEIPRVECYPQSLNQVFLNLLVNAGQAIDGEGKVTITTSPEPGEAVSITFTDSGRGIPPEVQPRIFASGFTTKPAGVGTGLGLSIAKQIVEERHEGQISFESRVGEGTSFRIVLPVRQAQHAGAREST
jgi:signal transduction histidine kinase